MIESRNEKGAKKDQTLFIFWLFFYSNPWVYCFLKKKEVFFFSRIWFEDDYGCCMIESRNEKCEKQVKKMLQIFGYFLIKNWKLLVMDSVPRTKLVKEDLVLFTRWFLLPYICFDLIMSFARIISNLHKFSVFFVLVLILFCVDFFNKVINLIEKDWL